MRLGPGGGRVGDGKLQYHLLMSKCDQVGCEDNNRHTEEKNGTTDGEEAIRRLEQKSRGQQEECKAFLEERRKQFLMTVVISHKKGYKDVKTCKKGDWQSPGRTKDASDIPELLRLNWFPAMASATF